MKKIFPLLLILSLLLMSFPVTAFAAGADEDPYEAFLRLGAAKPDFEQLVGGLQIWNDAETLFVEFVADEPYCISALHLQIGNDLANTPDGKRTTPPGDMAINESYAGIATFWQRLAGGPFVCDPALSTQCFI